MATKTVEVVGLGEVKIYKRKGNRNISLRLSPGGQIQVSLPSWLPYAAGASFAASKAQWIASQKTQLAGKLTDGQIIGKAHHLYFEKSSVSGRIHTKLKDNRAIVILPEAMNGQDEAVQQAAKSVGRRALRTQAEQLLPARLAELANTGDFKYQSVNFRSLSARWGSCDSKTNITLSIYLMLLPWQLIDYVIWHELTHTRIMRHGPDFWRELERHVPDAGNRRRQIRNYRPSF